MKEKNSLMVRLECWFLRNELLVAYLILAVLLSASSFFAYGFFSAQSVVECMP